MKTTSMIWMRNFVFAFVVYFAGAAAVYSQGSLNEAKKLMEHGQYRQAEAVFWVRTEKDSKDADSWYWWGVCRLKQGQTADQLFLKAVGLEPAKYTTMIGKAYRQEAEAFLAKGKMDTARILFDGAVSWDKTLKSVIGQHLFNIGQYDLTVRYAPELKDAIADIFFNRGEALDGKTCLPYYREAKKYSAKHNEVIKEKLLSIATSKYEEKDITFWRGAAVEFGEIPPDYKIYQPGTYTFSLKAGEKTNHWIMFQLGKLINYSVCSPDYQIKILYDDGQIVKDGKNVVLPDKVRDKFKIIAITDQPKITMEVVEGHYSNLSSK